MLQHKRVHTQPAPHILRDIPAAGDVEGFRQLFCAYAPLVKSYALRLGADAPTAEEISQETMLTVWRKVSLFESHKGSLKSWIFTIARNLRIDRLRKEFRWSPLPDGYEQLPSEEIDPDEAWAYEERRIRVQRALTTLSADQHQVISLCFVDGLSHSEIALRLNLPLGTVKSRLRLSYMKVREMVEDLR